MFKQFVAASLLASVSLGVQAVPLTESQIKECVKLSEAIDYRERQYDRADKKLSQQASVLNDIDSALLQIDWQWNQADHNYKMCMIRANHRAAQCMAEANRLDKLTINYNFAVDRYNALHNQHEQDIEKFNRNESRAYDRDIDKYNDYCGGAKASTRLVEKACGNSTTLFCK